MVRGLNRGLRSPTEDGGINGPEHCQGSHPAERPCNSHSSVRQAYVPRERAATEARHNDTHALREPRGLHRTFPRGS